MSEATEMLEHAEHAGHAAHGGGPGKLIGLSMAIFGVMLALCAAKVGAERTELTKAMVQQTQISTESQANQMKYRLVMLELEKIRATTDPGTTVNPDTHEGRALSRLMTLVVQYIAWKEAAKTWVKAYDPIIEAHSEATEGYEHAQLAAEVGIVIASIALLTASRKVWAVALVFGSAGIVALGYTYVHSGHEIHEAEQEVAQAKGEYAHLRTIQDPNADDQHTIDLLDPGGAKRAEIAKAYAAVAERKAGHEGSPSEAHAHADAPAGHGH